ncbi:MAG: GTP-binding protein [Candidatus Lokiarchaeota archaeon]|nr:GTP-binding protein [Candidatus Lokiarchaeota archaeon]
MSQSKKFSLKIVVVGDGGIGKSTMIQRLITGKYIEQKITIGTDLASWSIDLDNLVIKLQIWDFAGEKRFRFFLPSYARGADGCLLCYDVTRYTSFQNLQEWYDIVKNNTKDPGFVLVGGKVDLVDSRRTVQFEAAEEFQKQHNIEYYFETSSKSGYNTKEIFETLTKLILKKRNII